MIAFASAGFTPCAQIKGTADSTAQEIEITKLRALTIGVSFLGGLDLYGYRCVRHGRGGALLAPFVQLDPTMGHSVLRAACAGSAVPSIPGCPTPRYSGGPQRAILASLVAVPLATAQSRSPDHPGVLNGPRET